MSRFQVKKVAVLGAGVMGAQIAAHLVNVRVPVVLFDLPAKEGPKNGIVTRAIEGLKKLKPAPLGVADDAALIEQANYEEHLAQLGDCDLVIEAIAERMDWKLDLYQKIAPHRRAARDRRVQHLGPVDHQAERGAARSHQAALLRHPLLQPAALHVPGGADRHADHRRRTCSTSSRPSSPAALGKGVVRAHDTPNFIANRVGIAGMLATMKEVEKFGLTLRRGRRPHRQEARPRRARAPSAPPTWWASTPWRTSSRRCRTTWTTTSDPFYASFGTPPVLADAAGAGQPGPEDQGRLLQEGRARHPALRPAPSEATTCPAAQKADEVYGRMLKKPAGERLKLLRDSEGRAGPVPVGHPARQLPLRRRAPGDHRRDRARRRPRDALGLRHEAGPVRALAGGRLAAGGAVDPGRHRRRQGAVERAAAGLGVRGPGGRGRRRAHAAGLVERRRAAVRAAAPAAGVCAPAVPRDACSATPRPTLADGRHDDARGRRRPPVDARRRGADRQHQDEDARHQPRRGRRPGAGGRAGRDRTTRAW